MTLHKDKASDEAANGDAVRIDQDIKDTSSVAKDASSHLTEEKIENGAEEITSQTELGRPRHGSAEEEEDEDDEQAGVDGKEQVDEQLRRKRDREGSLEPSLSSSQQGTSTPDAIPTKKNRLQTDVIGEETTAPASTSAAKGDASVGPSSSPTRSGAGGLQEGEKVGQIRKRVRDLSWKQRKEGDRDDDDQEDEEEAENGGEKESTGKEGEERPNGKGKVSKSIIEDSEGGKTVLESEDKPPSLPRRTQPTFESFASSPSSRSAAAASSSPPADTVSAAVRKQPTFSSFSSSSSPFSSAAVNVAGPSWLGSKASTSSSGIKPSSLGTSVGGGHGEASSSPAPAKQSSSSSSADSSAAPKAAASGSKQLGFGAFATSKPFSAVPSGGTPPPKSVATETASSSLSDEQTNANANVNASSTANGITENVDKTTEQLNNKEKESKSFDVALREGGMTANEASALAGKPSTRLDRSEADLRTGEEDETSIFSSRAKLYTMAADKNWKERGTGTVRCNVPKKDAGSARLVMRAEGVLRLILNVNLFEGMKINVEQDKFVRFVAMEGGQLVHFALKLGNPAAARGFLDAVRSCIPEQSAGGTAAQLDVAQVA